MNSSRMFAFMAEFGGIADELHNCVRTIATLLFPNGHEAGKRLQFEIYFSSQLLRQLRVTDCRRKISKKDLERHIDVLTTAYGGPQEIEAALAEGPSHRVVMQQISRRLKQWRAVGRMIDVMARLHFHNFRGGASLNRAAFFVCSTPEGTNSSRKEALEAWVTMAPVRHFCYAELAAGGVFEPILAGEQCGDVYGMLLDAMYFDRSIDAYASLADAAARFLENTTPLRSNNPICPKGVLLPISQQVEIAPCDLWGPEFSLAERDLLSKYRAPTIGD